jgi:hypothetical protein
MKLVLCALYFVLCTLCGVIFGCDTSHGKGEQSTKHQVQSTKY